MLADKYWRHNMPPTYKKKKKNSISSLPSGRQNIPPTYKKKIHCHVGANIQKKKTLLPCGRPNIAPTYEKQKLSYISSLPCGRHK